MQNHYNYNERMFKLLDMILKKNYPNEAKKFAMVVNNTEYTKEDYELKEFLKESLIGSISRYYVPMKSSSRRRKK